MCSISVFICFIHLMTVNCRGGCNVFSIRMFVVFFIISLVTFNSSLFCQTHVRGPVSGVWDLDGSPYIVIDDIRVPAREALRIEPGVSILFVGGRSFHINGLLIAEGEEDNSILFSPLEHNSAWFGIDIVNADDETRFSFCAIEGSEAPAEWNDPNALGGGLYCSRTDITITNSTFSNNYANESGGGAYFDNCSPTLEDNLFTKNSADRDAGAIYFNECEGVFLNNLVENNRAIRYSGGGVFLRRSSTRVGFNRIFRNVSGTQWGCGLYMDYDCSPEIDRNLICQNMQGGIYMGDQCEPELFIHNTVADNEGRTAILLFSSCRLRLINCIVYGNIDTNWLVSGSHMWMDYSDVENPALDAVTVGEGVFDEDPLFENPDLLDYRLQINSPCVDAGDPDSPRDLNNSLADIGALSLNLVDGEADMFIDPIFLEVEEPGEYVFNITNVGDNRLLWHSSCTVNWITCEPERMLLEADIDVDVFVRITEEGLNDGINEGEIIIISNDRVNPEFRIPVEVTIGNNVEFTTNPLDRDYTLSAPYPNPFNNTTQVHFSIPRSGLFTLAIFDLSGREMAGIYDGYLTAGNHQIEVQSGNLTAGVYILKSMFENEQSNHKVVLIK